MGHRTFRSLLLAAALGLCTAPAAAHDLESHGDPRAALPDSLVTESVAAAEMGGTQAITPAAGTGLPETWCGTESTVDRTVNQRFAASAPQLKLIYAYAADQPNRFAQLADGLQGNVSLLSRYIAQQSGGRKTLRWDMGTECGADYVDVQVVRLPRNRSQYVVNGAPQFQLTAADTAAIVEPAQPGPKNWVIYADGFYGTNGVAGTAWTFLDDAATATVHDQGRLEAVTFGPQTIPANGYAWPSVMLHEITHNLGAVQDSAPNSTWNGHCNDRYDLMCYADGGSRSAPVIRCARIAGTLDETFDCNGDDYFNPAPAFDSYLDTHWNVYGSGHLATCTSQFGAACDGTATDGIAPADTTPRLNATADRRGPYSVTLSGSDDESAVDGFAWKVDGGPVVYDRTATVADGTTLRTRVRDAAGNWSRWRADTVRVDGVAPSANLACPAQEVEAAELSCTLAPDADTQALEVQVGDGSVQSRPSTDWSSIRVATHGETVVRARATDRVGNVGEWQSATVRLDAKAPWARVDCPVRWQPGPTDCTVTAGDGDDPPAALTWTIDGVAAGSGPSGSTFTVSGHGGHTVHATATGADGDTARGSATVNIDMTPPTATLTCEEAWSATTALCKLKVDDLESGPADAEFRVDGGAPVAPDYVISVKERWYVVRANGVHEVEGTVRNNAGHSSGWVGPVTTRVDTVKPVAALACPTGWVAAESVSCSASATDADSGVARLEWRLGHETATTAVPGTETDVTVTREGTTEVVLGAFDGVANAADAVRATVRLDRGDPAVAVDCPEGTQGSATDCTVTASDAVSGLAELKWSVDGGAEQSASPGSTVSVGEEGRHTIVATARDVAGRIATATREVVIDLADDPPGEPLDPPSEPLDPPGEPLDPPSDDAPAVAPTAAAPPPLGDPILPFAQPPLDDVARVALRTRTGRRLADATVTTPTEGRAQVRVRPRRVAPGAWRLRTCAGRRCATMIVRLRRGRPPRALTVRLAAAEGTRLTFALQRRDARGRFRTVARGAARVV